MAECRIMRRVSPGTLVLSDLKNVAEIHRVLPTTSRAHTLSDMLSDIQKPYTLAVVAKGIIRHAVIPRSLPQ